MHYNPYAASAYKIRAETQEIQAMLARDEGDFKKAELYAEAALESRTVAKRYEKTS